MNEPMVKFIVRNGASATARDNEGTTPLCLAARRDKFCGSEDQDSVVWLLLEAGADIVSAGNNSSALDRAVRGSSPRMHVLVRRWRAHVVALEYAAVEAALIATRDLMVPDLSLNPTILGYIAEHDPRLPDPKRRRVE